MEIIIAINKLLENKLVQWSLLVLLAMFIYSNVLQSIKYNALRVSNAITEKNYSEAQASIRIQNDAIKQLGESFRLKEEALQQATQRAHKIAIENDKNLSEIRGLKMSGTCEDILRQGLEILNEK